MPLGIYQWCELSNNRYRQSKQWIILWPQTASIYILNYISKSRYFVLASFFKWNQEYLRILMDRISNLEPLWLDVGEISNLTLTPVVHYHGQVLFRTPVLLPSDRSTTLHIISPVVVTWSVSANLFYGSFGANTVLLWHNMSDECHGALNHGPQGGSFNG